MNASQMLAARALQMSASGQFLSKTEAVPSPCISVCRMALDGSHCEGCFRTLDDIRHWSKAGSEERRTIWSAALRRAGLMLPEGLE